MLDIYDLACAGIVGGTELVLIRDIGYCSDSRERVCVGYDIAYTDKVAPILAQMLYLDCILNRECGGLRRLRCFGTYDDIDQYAERNKCNGNETKVNKVKATALLATRRFGSLVFHGIIPFCLVSDY